MFNWILGNLSCRCMVTMPWHIFGCSYSVWAILRRLSALTRRRAIKLNSRIARVSVHAIVLPTHSSPVQSSHLWSFLRQTRVNHSSCSSPAERLIGLWRHQSPRYDITSSRDHAGNAAGAVNVVGSAQLPWLRKTSLALALSLMLLSS